MFKAPYVKKLLVFGIALLVIGLLLVISLNLFKPVEEVMKQDVDVTIKWKYYITDRFRVESGSWLNLNLGCAQSALSVEGQTVGEIYRVEGMTYDYKIPIQSGDVYFITIEDKNVTYGFFSAVWGECHILGEFSVTRTPSYVSPLETVGAVFLVIGSIILPVGLLVEFRTRWIAKRVFPCPNCRREVRVGFSSCPYCKLDLTKYWIACKYCGKLYDSHLGKCPKCGADA